MARLKNRISFVLLVGVAFVAGGCAFDLAHVSFEPTQFVQPLDHCKTFVVANDVPIDTPCNYDRLLRKGSSWKLVGTIPKGEVYKPLDQVLTVECSNIFEAYLVVSEGHMVGFYLPVEKGFVPLSKGIELPME